MRLKCVSEAAAAAGPKGKGGGKKAGKAGKPKGKARR